MSWAASHFKPESFLTFSDNLEFFVRIFYSTILGCVIGFERSRRMKDAGIRTHAIICLTSAVFMVVSKYAFLDMEGAQGSKGADISRIASQVVSGISFIGAGVIFKRGRSMIRGLTTAAGMWATAAVGLAIGAGMYWVGTAETILLMILQYILHHFEPHSENSLEQEVEIVMPDESRFWEGLENLLKKHKAAVNQTSYQKSREAIALRLSLRLDYQIRYEEVVAFMRKYPEVTKLNVSD